MVERGDIDRGVVLALVAFVRDAFSAGFDWAFRRRAARVRGRRRRGRACRRKDQP
jgi:hypothetical protein